MLKAEWRLRPPVHWLLANFLKYEPPAESASSTPITDEELASFFGGG